MGTFPRVTHPSATDTRRCPFDLHVLGLPPAFALSQDQTLKLEILISAGHYVIDGVCTLEQRFHCLCELQNVVPPKSHRPRDPRIPVSARTPPSTFLFLSSLVKEQHRMMRLPRTLSLPTEAGEEAKMFQEASGPNRFRRRLRDEAHMAPPVSFVNTGK
jgi:hypothetical protein